jgi:hypothetical protein
MIMSLAFSFLYFGCTRNKRGEELYIDWKGGKAVTLVIPIKLVGDIDKSKVQVFLSSTNGPAILGEYKLEADKILFEPVIPFTIGLKYRVMADGELVGEIEIPRAYVTDTPEVVAVYPTNDTVPENLLKLYVEFNKPMREGEALKHLVLVKNGKDTLSDVFLDLQPELWNKEHTILTVWLDPGRIKRDLQPNLLMGPPLSKGNKYTLTIRKEWLDIDGAELVESFKKDFVVAGRDSISPDPENWAIKIPNAGTTQTLNFYFKESLDYLVLKNAIHIVDSAGMELPLRRTYFLVEETAIGFEPKEPWKRGIYYLTVESRLEDLAGNNLDHPFDNDITQKQNKNPGKGYKKLIKIE